MNSDFIAALELVFHENANLNRANKMEAYLKNKFPMFGIHAPLRDEISAPFLIKTQLPLKSELHSLVKELWLKPEREFHHFAQNLVLKYVKQFTVNDIELLEFMAVNNSWWDTIDFIATKLMAAYFKLYPEQIIPITDSWMKSGNIWLQRSCLIFQLKHKQDLDTILLSQFINALNSNNAFFIKKAIGWVLREYSKTNPQWVINFVNNTPLKPLSKREALKYISISIEKY